MLNSLLLYLILLQVKYNLNNWLALHRVPGVGPIKFQQWLQNNPTLEQLPSWVEPNWKAVALDLKWQQQENCHIITLLDDNYPPLLKTIANPPPILFMQGNINLLATQQLAIVGSRYPSQQGSEIAYNFAKHFVTLGFTVTSGLALGIDTASHKGALTTGNTIAVLGCGLEQIYPAANKTLANSILANQGLLLTEFPIGAAPKAGNFPSRNRIISGLSLGTLVVEAAINSGALITAALATEQGREVFAIPGSIYNTKSKGCHKLIKQGAKLVESAADILEELNPVLTNNKFASLVTNTAQRVNKITNDKLTTDQIELLRYFNNNITTINEMILVSKRPATEIINLLTQLELDGYISSTPGGYIRTIDISTIE